MHKYTCIIRYNDNEHKNCCNYMLNPFVYNNMIWYDIIYTYVYMCFLCLSCDSFCEIKDKMFFTLNNKILILCINYLLNICL